jgi:threonine synthase
MKFISTSGRTGGAAFAEALWSGVAPDGGLYVPEVIPANPRLESLDGFREATVAEIAVELVAPYASDFMDRDTLGELLRRPLAFDAPLVRLDERTYLVELFHGPTYAFKDFGAQTLARLLTHSFRHNRAGRRGRLTVLVATSGDTGSAVAHAFRDIEDVRVVVLYPKGKVSPLQEAQFATLGGNVDAYAVEGSFDDCQRLVKAAFADSRLRERVTLTSANSINIGRLLPQMAYYVRAAAQLPPSPRQRDSAPPVFVTPSGNFGNLVAGLMTARMGLPVTRFVAATNANDVFPAYLTTGVFSPKPSQATISNAMDVGSPSNFARVAHLYEGDVARVRAEIAGVSISDGATRDVIQKTWERYGKIVDPHTAVGIAGLDQARQRRAVDPNAAAIVLSTAHPAKFADIIDPIIGAPTPIPGPLDRCRREPVLSRPLAAESSALFDALWA